MNNYKILSILLLILIIGFIGWTQFNKLIKLEAERINFPGWILSLRETAYKKGINDVYNAIKTNGSLKIGDITLIIQ